MKKHRAIHRASRRGCKPFPTPFVPVLILFLTVGLLSPVSAGDKSSAAWEADQIRALEPGFSAKRWLDSYPMTDIGQRTEMLRVLGQLDL